MIKPKLELKSQADTDLLASATVIKNALTTNAAEFPTAAATVTALGTKLTAYATALQAAMDGKVAQQALIDAKDANRDALETVLRTLANLVGDTAQGDINLIHDAGMQGSNEPTPVSMTQVMNLQVVAGENEGELVAQWQPVTGRVMYQVQICTDTNMPPTNWADKLQCTKSRCVLNDTLVSGTKVWVRVRALGTNDIGPWSDPAWKRVP